MSSLRPLHRQAAQHFDEHHKRKQNHFWASQNSLIGSLGTKLWVPNIYIWVFFFESTINFLQVTKTFLKVAKFWFMYSFTQTDIFFLFKHLPTEIAIFKNICYQMKCFSGDSFSFSRSRFWQYFTYFLISCEVQTRYSEMLKYYEQHIRDHLSGTRVRIWIGSKYDAVFSYSCIASCNLTHTFTFSCMSFSSRIRLWIIQTVNLFFLCFWNVALKCFCKCV